MNCKRLLSTLCKHLKKMRRILIKSSSNVDDTSIDLPPHCISFDDIAQYILIFYKHITLFLYVSSEANMYQVPVLETMVSKDSCSGLLAQ